MKRLLPDIYWSPSGRHGIIDTGKTIEFWLKDFGKDGHLIAELLDWMILNNIHSTKDKSKVPVKIDGFDHYVSIEKDKLVNKAFVFLHLVDKNPRLFESDLSETRYLLGVIPTNSHIDHIIIKNINQLKQGRIYMIQYDPPNIKVIFPYRYHKFDKNGELVIDYNMKKDKRFDDLVFGE